MARLCDLIRVHQSLNVVFDNVAVSEWRDDRPPLRRDDRDRGGWREPARDRDQGPERDRDAGGGWRRGGDEDRSAPG